MSRPGEIIVVFSTVSPDKSELLAKNLLDSRVVACVNVMPVRSYYRWKGESCDEPEHLLIAKTTREKAEEVITVRATSSQRSASLNGNDDLRSAAQLAVCGRFR